VIGVSLCHRCPYRPATKDVAEAGDIFALDQKTGQFLWAMTFPYDVPNVNMKGIDVDTGRTHINDALVFKKDGDHSIGCFQNPRSYWATSYDPKNNSLYVPFQDACLDMPNWKWDQRPAAHANDFH
jgi:glucose dehydrogenase